MTAEHVRLGGEIQQETTGVSENHALLCTIPGVVAVETFGTVSTSWMLMTKLDGLIHELRGEWIWDVLWNAFHGKSFSLRGFGGVQTPKCSPPPAMEPLDQAP